MNRPCHNIRTPGTCCYVECRSLAVVAVTHRWIDGRLVECLRCAEHLTGEWISSRPVNEARR